MNIEFRNLKRAALVMLTQATMAFAGAPPQLAARSLRLLQLNHTTGLTIVDVRPPAEFVKSHIQGAVNVIAAAIEHANLPRDGRIVVYCSEPTCPLSTNAASTLISDGYPMVFLLEGGFRDWLKNGYPVQAGNAQTVNSSHRHIVSSDSHIKDTLIIDLRKKLDYCAGHIPHARNLPIEQLDRDLVRLPKDRELVVYDVSAARSHQAADILTAAGFKVSELSGGLAGWTKRGRTLVTKE